MLVYSIQPVEVFEALEREGVLHADPAKGPHVTTTDDQGRTMTGFESSYDWLREQMKLRTPEYAGGEVWWAWVDKPDLRSHRRLYSSGSRHVCLTLDVPESRMLLSDFDAWAQVLNHGYVTYTEEESLRWDAYAALSPWEEWMEMSFGERFAVERQMWNVEITPEVEEWRAHLHEIRRASWESIFSDEGYRDPAAKDWMGDSPSFQATFEELRVEEVRAVRPFTGKGRR